MDFYSKDFFYFSDMDACELSSVVKGQTYKKSHTR